MRTKILRKEQPHYASSHSCILITVLLLTVDSVFVPQSNGEFDAAHKHS